MVVGILQVELTIDGAESLKDKRRVVSSLKDRLHRQHQVSVAETARQDDRHVAVLGLAMVSTSVPHCQSVLDTLVNEMRQQRGCYLNRHDVQILTGYGTK